MYVFQTFVCDKYMYSGFHVHHNVFQTSVCDRVYVQRFYVRFFRHLYVTEDDEVAAITIQRLGYLGHTLSVTYTTEELSRPETVAGVTVYHALEGADYQPATGIVTFDAGMVSTLKLNPYRTGINFRRQNLTSIDVRFWRLKSIPALWELFFSNSRRPIT